MKISVPLQNGWLPDRYTKHANDSDKIDGRPYVSFPINIEEVPTNVQSLALVLTDDDAIPVCGFTYIHWVAANIDPKTTLIPENASHAELIPMTYGHNSLAGQLLDVQDPMVNEHYVGPTPPDKPHDYHLTLYALDQKLTLKNGFWLNELEAASTDHVLAEANAILPVKN
ncbi:YbhB/YbcL family Raf kinase inhibitor-like protein [Fructilactobacillus sanfranciscensis]|uniref:YbhB/YbcL family Raf kinase inhibitor-like protein n=1 Tax=Fructilactobacillus sanfranciscensis TaxID=1625 RepID=UPI0013D2A9C2|nr:YbhB/YbcL family Raf kinase inhibitor-like protein [Fructilactobacillus sanfranciscensis]MDN4462159.1 YbhB/YbcL family Raf kinase inhibitor-like protein [Fructilactobacillus sanfranciscensis]NDR61715.1 YbhB/YbcL family Raf kinase inhibitor-like protein [Fructilactobacillus sanfranciscensis]